jgi:hypothetical protein
VGTARSPGASPSLRVSRSRATVSFGRGSRSVCAATGQGRSHRRRGVSWVLCGCAVVGKLRVRDCRALVGQGSFALLLMQWRSWGRAGPHHGPRDLLGVGKGGKLELRVTAVV